MSESNDIFDDMYDDSYLGIDHIAYYDSYHNDYDEYHKGYDYYHYPFL